MVSIDGEFELSAEFPFDLGSEPGLESLAEWRWSELTASTCYAVPMAMLMEVQG